MKEQIHWGNNTGWTQFRMAICQQLGWTNSEGFLTPMGKRIASTGWDDQTDSVREVLTRAGIVK